MNNLVEVQIYKNLMCDNNDDDFVFFSSEASKIVIFLRTFEVFMHHIFY